jgi:type IV pilus assembly protein PilP
MKSFLFISVIILFSFSLFSCEDKTQVRRPAPPPRRTAPPTPPVIKIEKTEQKKNEKIAVAVKYDPQGRRDPFLSILTLMKQKIEKAKKKRTIKKLNPLENYDVTDLRLLGIIFDGREYFASIVLPDGKAFTIKKGMTLGLNDGKVIHIDKEGFTVREFVMSFFGKMKPKDTVKKLRKEEE